MKDINKLLQQKKLNISSDNLEDIKKVKIIEQLISDKACFFKLSKETSVGILSYLGVPDDEILDWYYELISINNFQELPVVRTIVDSEKLK